MNPTRFLGVGGTTLLIVGLLGVAGRLQSMSRASFFNPPYWINWFHVALGAVVTGVRLAGSARLQSFTTLVATVMGLTLGSLGLVLGRRAARQFNIPEAGLLLILGVDVFLDMGRSATNAVGNSIASAAVAKWEGELLPEREAAENERRIESGAVVPA